MLDDDAHPSKSHTPGELVRERALRPGRRPTSLERLLERLRAHNAGKGIQKAGIGCLASVLADPRASHDDVAPLEMFLPEPCKLLTHRERQGRPEEESSNGGRDLSNPGSVGEAVRQPVYLRGEACLIEECLECFLGHDESRGDWKAVTQHP